MAASTNTLVQDVLENARNQFETVEVKKDIELDIDCGNLLACDPNPIDNEVYRANKDEFLQSLVRDNTQLLFNQIWKLPINRVDDVVVAELPAPTTRIPREKPIPQARPMTKWEEYAKLKGINKRKKTRLVFDEATQEYIPRFGYKSNNDPKKDWLIEVPNSADPYQDMFAKKREAKKERVAKNELQRLRNIARAQKLKLPGQGLEPKPTQSKLEVNKAIHLAKKSTASIGRFEERLPKEPIEKNAGRRRKFDPLLGHLEKEKDREKKILNHILLGKPKIDVVQAVNQEMREGDIVQEEKASQKKGEGKGSRKALPKTVKRGSRQKKGKYR